MDNDEKECEKFDEGHVFDVHSSNENKPCSISRRHTDRHIGNVEITGNACVPQVVSRQNLQYRCHATIGASGALSAKKHRRVIYRIKLVELEVKILKI